MEGNERTLETVVADVARLYRAETTHREIAAETELTESQVKSLLHGLFGAGLPKRWTRAQRTAAAATERLRRAEAAE